MGMGWKRGYEGERWNGGPRHRGKKGGEENMERGRMRKEGKKEEWMGKNKGGTGNSGGSRVKEGTRGGKKSRKGEG